MVARGRQPGVSAGGKSDGKDPWTAPADSDAATVGTRGALCPIWRLLDPNRYADLEQFREETLHYEEVAIAVNRLVAGGDLTAADKALFVKKSPHLKEHLDAMKSGVAGERDKLIAALLDELERVASCSATPALH